MGVPTPCCTWPCGNCQDGHCPPPPPTLGNRSPTSDPRASPEGGGAPRSAGFLFCFYVLGETALHSGSQARCETGPLFVPSASKTLPSPLRHQEGGQHACPPCSPPTHPMQLFLPVWGAGSYHPKERQIPGGDSRPLPPVREGSPAHSNHGRPSRQRNY